MATYKKKDKTSKEIIKDKAYVESESTTKEVFEGLDSGANKIEKWILKRQKYILIALAAIVALVLAYMAYLRFVKEPNEKKAADELAYPRVYFDKAITMEEPSDSLLKLGLNGDGAKYGFVDIADEYSGTKAGNMAKYYAGISYLKMADYKKAIEYLDQFSSDDLILGAVAKGAIGDAFTDLNQPEDALKYYEKALDFDTNLFSTPMFLDKAAKTCLALKDFKKAETYFQRIKDEFPNSTYAVDIDAKISQAKLAQ